jgi:DNA-binding response OmpR family regulator
MKQALLVIDDGENIEMLLGRIAEQYLPDLRIISAKNGTEGLEKARTEHPDMILLDVKLPDIEGFDVCRLLRADPQTKDIKIMLISGVAREPGDVVEGMESGADDYIFKPFVVPDMVQRLQKLMRGK